jgi:hypothetical protein
MTKLRVVAPRSQDLNARGRIKVRLGLDAGPKTRTPGPLTKTSTVHLRDRSVDAPMKARPLPTDHIDLAQCSIHRAGLAHALEPIGWHMPARESRTHQRPSQSHAGAILSAAET